MKPDWRSEFDMLTRQEVPRTWFVFYSESEGKKKTKRWFMNYIGDNPELKSSNTYPLLKSDKRLLTYYRNKIAQQQKL